MTNPAGLPSENEVLRNALLAQGKQIEDLTNIVRSALTPAPIPPREYTPEELRENPHLVLQQVKEHMNSLAAPVTMMQAQMTRISEYKSVKERVKANNPELAKIWDKIVSQLDSTFDTGKFEVNETVVTYQASAIAGQLLLKDPTLRASLDEKPNMFIPPSGSPTPQPSNNNQKVYRDLTEPEQIVAKMRNQTKEQFLDALENSNPTVVTRGGTK